MRGVAANERGFTLAEVVVSVAILALIGVMTFGTFADAMTTRDSALEISGRYHEIRQGMLRMAREIPTAFVSEHRDCDDPRTRTLFKADGASNGMRLDFTSFSHVKLYADANESDQNELSYFIDNDSEGGTTSLYRREATRIDDEPEEGGVEQVLIHDVETLNFEFYDPKDDEWRQDWDTTSLDFKGRLPMFVRIELEAKGPSGEKERFVTKTRIFLQKSLKIVGTGFASCID